MNVILSQTCIKSMRLYVKSRQFQRLTHSTGSERKGLVLGVYSDKSKDNSIVELTAASQQFNNRTNGKLVDLLKQAGNKLRPGKNFIFWGLDPEFAAVSIVALDSNPKHDDLELISHASEQVRVSATVGVKALEAADIKNVHIEDFGNAEAAAEGAVLSSWKFQEHKTKKDELSKVCLWECCQSTSNLWERGEIKANAQNLARFLADSPGNLMTPTIFSEKVKEILSPLNISVDIRDRKWVENEKMGAFLAVAQGSKEPLKFVEIHYNNGNADPIVLIGKGVTFDAGGISLKPAGSMDEMRADMGGAACVVGAVHALAQLKSPINVKVLIPLTENLPSGTAVKPGDVVIARNGKTICVDNTDAEGRLVLADALCYSSIYKPKFVLDIATLTGAMRVALGNAATGVFTNSTDLYNKLETAGSDTGDRVWRLPLWKLFSKYITENPAYDLNNIGKNTKGGGSCIAAAFLKEFVPSNTPWLHLDIAGVMGPSDVPYLNKGMSGRPTRTLIEFIDKQSR